MASNRQRRREENQGRAKLSQAAKEGANVGARMRKTLPEDIEQIIASGDVEAVARAVKNCQVGAYLRTDAYKPQLMHFPASQEITEFFLQRG